jgi:hypothetical protein
MTYEERVRAIAEEMAIEHLTLNTWSYASISSQNEAIENQVGKAQIAVKWMEEIGEICFHKGWSDARPSGDMREEYDELRKRFGLIPDQEAGEDETD